MNESSNIQLLINSSLELFPVFEKVLLLIDTNQKARLQRYMQIGEQELNEYINRRIQEMVALEGKKKELINEIQRNMNESLIPVLKYLEEANVTMIPVDHVKYIQTQLDVITSLDDICKSNDVDIEFSAENILKTKSVINKLQDINKPQIVKIKNSLEKII